jgi:hypothetical protein
MSTRRGRWTAAVLIVLSLGAAGCAATASPQVAAEAPAKVEAIVGKDVKSVQLTKRAAERVGIVTIPVAATPGQTTTTVPYSAVIYTPDGSTWVYTVTRPLTYVREKVVVANVGGAKGDEAFLSSGPAAGTEVVRTGLVELYGAELGVGK